MVNALPGLLNSQANCWPMILISAASEAEQQGIVFVSFSSFVES
jgi:thiamine pyrophosphate-dependent acetolactate synthase large subunit-like protein